MTIFNLTYDIPRMYKNDGQHKEQKAVFNLTGKIKKADNIKFSESADCLDIQIKSSHCSICSGTNLKEHLDNDKAVRYGYVVNSTEIMYIMNRSEYIEFVTTFSTIEKDSIKNGGKEKIRLKRESEKMIKWLEDRV